MEPSIFRYTWRYSKRQQMLLLTLIACSMPFYYFALDLPKIIVDQAILGTEFPKPLEINIFGLGIPIGSLDQITYLAILCNLLLFMVIVNGGFKYFVKVFQGMLGERMLRRLRYDLLDRSLRFPLPHYRKVSQGEIVAMVNAETEPLGGYIGEALATPAFEGGLLIVNLAFIFAQDPILGAAAIALYPLQAWLIPKMQRRVNRLGKERVRNARMLSDRIGEVVSGIQEVHANDTGALMRADYAHRLGIIFFIRAKIYKLKFLIKFLNNFISDLTPYFFYGLGGYLVIRGQIEIGALLAIINAYKNVQPQWKMLLDYYQRKEDA
ncbi:MAG: ABC transporter ATP-binding protein, partial [Pseudomonadota bacterium]